MPNLCVLTLLLSSAAFGQSRLEELRLQRAEYAKGLSTEKLSGAEKLLVRVKDERLLERTNYGFNGLSAKLGGLVTGGGFAFGPQYFRGDLRDGAVTVRASAQVSLRNYQRADAELRLPKLLNGKAWLDVRATRRNYPGIAYYGPGPDSEKNRTNYRLEDTAFDGSAGLSPWRHFTLGGGGGLLFVNVGPGKDRRFQSTEQAFPASVAPGIDTQTDFYRYGTFAQLDYRDDAFGPRNGGNYVMQYTRFEDRDRKMHDFNLMDLELQQYFGFFNKSRVIALRAHTRLTDTRSGQSVPFYLQPLLGGSDDLRGFRPFRFSGNNSVAFTAEYRWAIFSGCDGAVFADAGKVFQRRGQLNFRNLESSVGGGLRFNARNRTFLRVDVGVSHEGFQVWFKFNDVFQQRPLGTMDSQPIL
ncbi:MAG: hypothetical protein U0R19_41075 [Bryobacteraceae bacterium]